MVVEHAPIYPPVKRVLAERAAGVAKVSDVGDERVALYRNLKDRDLRGRQGLFLAESELVVRRLLRSRFVVRSLFLHPQRFEKIAAELADTCPTAPVFIATASIMEQIAGFPVHRGVLALAERGTPRDPASIIATNGPLLVLEDVADPDNIGSLFRSAAAFGYTGVLCSPGTADPLYRKAIRASMGTTLHLPFAFCPDWPATAHRLERVTIALTPDQTSPALEACAIPRRHALLVGAEGPGLSDDALRAAMVRAHVAMSRTAVDADTVDSLNVGVATAIGMYELTRREAGDMDGSPTRS